MKPLHDDGFVQCHPSYVFVRSFGASDLYYDPNMTRWSNMRYKFWLYHPVLEALNKKFDGMSDIPSIVTRPDAYGMTEDELAMLTATVVVLGEVNL